MNEQIAIKIQGLKKQYRLGQIGRGTLTEDLQTLWARFRKKEDPNSTIGALKRVYGQTFMALNGIDLTIHAGEAIGIIGRNGAGKSTMLKILSRITAPSAGTVDIYGRITSMLEVGTGFSPEMTGRENIYMNGAILGMTKSEIDEKIDDIIDFSEIRDFIDTPVKRYSSGMYVKLAFSVAAHLDSEIMIMDEVLAVGDMNFQKKCLDKMRDAAKTEGRTVLYVSHNMNTIRNLCDRCIVLDAGKIVFDGDVESAIGIYMEQSASELKTFYSYEKAKRQAYLTRKAELLECTFPGSETSSIPLQDDLHLTMRCRANRPIDEVYLRFEIFYSDDTIVGTSFSDKAVSAEENQVFDIDVTLTTKNFAPGIYHAAALLYERDENGNQIPTDRVSPAFYFRLVDEKSDNLRWLHRYWGHVHLDDMKIENITVQKNWLTKRR